MRLLWEEEAWEDYCLWQTRDKKLLKRINTLLKDIQRNTYEGIGKPEPLKGDLSGWWSRRIDDLDIRNGLPQRPVLFLAETMRRTVVDDDQFDVAQGLSHDRTQGLFDIGLRIVYGNDDADFRVIHRHVSILRVRRHNA